MGYVLGIDQGGSKTLAVLATTAGRLVAVGKSGGSYHATRGMTHAMGCVKQAVQGALATARATPEDIRQVCAGITGADFGYEYSILQGALRETLRLERVTVKNDCIIAMRPGQSRPGAAVICIGTGLNCAVVGPDGDELIYGYYISDCYQGGVSIGRSGLQAVLEAEAGVAPPTALTAAYLEWFGQQTVEELLQFSVNSGIASQQYAALAIQVIACAEAGDAAAREILTTLGSGAARFVLAGLAQKNMLGSRVEVVLSGSIFKSRLSIIGDAIQSSLREKAPLAQAVQAPYEPVVGAAMLALDELGAWNGACAGNIARTARLLGLERILAMNQDKKTDEDRTCLNRNEELT